MKELKIACGQEVIDYLSGKSSSLPLPHEQEIIKVKINRLLGSGKDGDVYEILEKDGKPCNNEVLKILNNSEVGIHVSELLSHIKGLIIITPTISCLPYNGGLSLNNAGNYETEYDPATGQNKIVNKYCLFMKKAAGADLTKIDENESESYHERLSLYDRLIIAYQISTGVNILHDHGIIHADIALDNIMTDTKKTYIVDVDGGGKVIPNIPPRVWGKPDFMAPELWDNNKRPNISYPPDIRSDCWALAVLIHYILIDDYSPFFFLRTIYEGHTYSGHWPPNENDYPNYSEFIQHHAELLQRLGPLAHLFIKTFRSGKGNPDERPTAKEWANTLRECGVNWGVCENKKCENYNVSRAAIPTPFCPISGNRLKIIGKPEDFPEDDGGDGDIVVPWWEKLWAKILLFFRIALQFPQRFSKQIIKIALIAIFSTTSYALYNYFHSKPSTIKTEQVNIEKALEWINAERPEFLKIGKAVETLKKNITHPKAKEGLAKATEIYINWGNSAPNDEAAKKCYEAALTSDQGDRKNEILEKLSGVNR